MNKLEELKALMKRAFPPVPWWRTAAHGNGKCDIRAIHMVGGTVSIEIAEVNVAGCGYGNADLIIAMHELLPQLIAVAEAADFYANYDHSLEALERLIEKLEPLTKDADK